MYKLALTRDELVLAAARWFQARTREKSQDGRWLPKRYLGLERQAAKNIKHAFKEHMLMEDGLPYGIKGEPKEVMRLLLAVKRLGAGELSADVLTQLDGLMAVLYQTYKDQLPDDAKLYELGFPTCYEVGLFAKVIKEQDEIEGGSTGYEADSGESLLSKVESFNREANPPASAEQPAQVTK